MDKKRKRPTTLSGVMDEKNSKRKSSYPESSITTETTRPNIINRRRHIVQNFLLIWLDTGVDQSKQDSQTTLTQLQNVVNNINIFTQPDECVDFLTEIDGMRVFLIVADAFGQQIMSMIHDIPQLHSIYILRGNQSEYEQWTEEWPKIKAVYTEITHIAEFLQQIVKQYNQDSIAVSFVPVSEGTLYQNLNQLEPAFMYTQMLKEILVGMNYNEQSIKYFATFCRNGNYGAPNNITRFENEYRTKSPVWWYTFPSFIYSMVNEALRTLEADIIINLGFFIRDLHHQIEQLYREQIDNYHGQPFIVYRGQCLTKTDFEKLLKIKGGLMAFNNFLSTTEDQEISRGYARAAMTKADTVGIIFRISIDPSVSSTPFASIREISYYHDAEQEILFSMHTVFRIREIIQTDENDPLYQVDLELTADDDQELRTLTKLIQQETSGETGWRRLGKLLIRISQFDKAEELYNVLLEQTSDEEEKANYYNQLGCLKDDQGDYAKAIWYHEKTREVFEKALVPDHPSLAISYNNIGSVYGNMGDYPIALSFYEKALEIHEKTLPPNYLSLAISYSNIGSVYASMGQYSQALSFYERSLSINQKTLPPNHPVLAISYNSIGSVYDNMGEYLKALSLYEKAFDIRQRTLPSKHFSLAISCNNIALVCDKLGEYCKALSFHKDALDIYQKTLHSNHPLVATSYNNIGEVHRNLREYPAALSFYEKALDIYKKTLPATHLLFATSYNNIAVLYANMKEYAKALSFHEKALDIYQKLLHPNHQLVATSYNNIGEIYRNMEEYSKALTFHDKVLDIYQKSLPSDHLSFATSYHNIALVYANMKEHFKALSYFERVLDIEQRLLPPNHPNLQNVREKIETIKKRL